MVGTAGSQLQKPSGPNRQRPTAAGKWHRSSRQTLGEPRAVKMHRKSLVLKQRDGSPGFLVDMATSETPCTPCQPESDLKPHTSTVSCCRRGLRRTSSPDRQWYKASVKLVLGCTCHQLLLASHQCVQWWPRAETAWSTSSHQPALHLIAAVSLVRHKGLWHMGRCTVIQAPPFIGNPVWLPCMGTGTTHASPGDMGA